MDKGILYLKTTTLNRLNTAIDRLYAICADYQCHYCPIGDNDVTCPMKDLIKSRDILQAEIDKG